MAAHRPTRRRKQTERLSLDFGPAGKFGSLPADRSAGKSPRELSPRGGTKFSSTGTRVPGTPVPGTAVDLDLQPYGRTKFSQTDHGSITRSDHVEKATPQVVTDEGDGTDGVTGELREDTQVPPNSRVSMPRQDPLKGFLSVGDPKQFLIAGSIGDRRVHILVDTGATISFIKSSLVPLLTPSPKVETSELSVILGNNATQDTDFFIDVDLRVKHCMYEANLHLLELPDAFDVIVGLDWLSRHDGHIRVRGRSLEIGDKAMGKRSVQ